MPSTEITEVSNLTVSTPSSKTLQLEKFRQELPIAQCRNFIVDQIRKNFVTVIIGETGSGKSTQIPQYVVDDPELRRCLLSTNHEPSEGSVRVCITQPRRMAAVSMAHRVAEERGTQLGEEVGYTIRFDDHSSAEKTYIKFVTDGIALREVLETGGFSRYHVWSSTVKKVCPKADVLPPFRVVITSATLEAQRISDFFFSAPVIEIPGRCYPVEIFYTPASTTGPTGAISARSAPSKSPLMSSTTMIEAAVNAALRLHLMADGEPNDTAPVGHILVFLTGRADCEIACQLMSERLAALVDSDVEVGDAIVIPLYGALTTEDQALVFQPCAPDCRKIVFSTNVAETSVTVEGVKYVVDLGMVKQKHSNLKTGVESLAVVRIAKSQAIQRCGRAGRSRAGKCFRIYTEEEFEEMPEAPVLEIHRMNLSSVVLQLKSLGCDDILGVEFLDSPPRDALLASLKQLFLLGALSADGILTNQGRRMVSLPLDPIYARCLLAAHDYDVVDDVAAIVALLSVEAIWIRPLETVKHNQPGYSDKQPTLTMSRKAMDRHRTFFHSSGDHMTLLNAFSDFCRVPRHRRHSWCRENYLHYRALSQACNIQQQLVELLRARRSRADGGVGRSRSPVRGRGGSHTSRILRSLCQGCFVNSAKLSSTSLLEAAAELNDGRRSWLWVTAKDGLLVGLDRSSSLLSKRRSTVPENVIFHEIVGPSGGSKQRPTGLGATLAGMMTVVSVIEREWIESLLPRFMQIDLRALNRSAAPQASCTPSTSNNPLLPFTAQPAVLVFEEVNKKKEAEFSEQAVRVDDARKRYLERRKLLASEGSHKSGSL